MAHILSRRPALLAAAALAPLLPGIARAQTDDRALIDRGAAVARAADCAACHTAPGGRPLAGGLPIRTPIGTIVSTNITPSRDGGIGAYSADQFARAVREGVRADGANLYPAMPYTAYSGMTDQDVRALYAYFHAAVAPVDVRPATTALPFPFNIRATMGAWNLLFLSHTRFTPDTAHDAQWNRGRYLADVLEHCGTCHTPRNLLMAEDDGRKYGGASLGAWYAPNITPSPGGIGAWSADDLKSYLKTGHAPAGNAQAGGEMLEAVDKSMSRLDDADIDAIVAYVRSLPPVSGRAVATPAHPRDQADDPLFASHQTVSAQMDGDTLYQAFCASCHQDAGQGRDSRGLPPLSGNAVFHDPTADNLVMTILRGIQSERNGEQAMPGFARTLNDDQIVRLTNALTARFGDPSVTTTTDRVAVLRQGGAPSPMIGLARAGLVGGVVLALAACGAAILLVGKKKK